MVKIYASLIKMGLKKLEDVPKHLQEAVKKELEKND